MEAFKELIKSGSKADIKNSFISLARAGKLDMAEALKVSPTAEIRRFLSELEQSPACAPGGAEGSGAALTEEEAVRKYLTGGDRLVKAAQMFFSVLKQNAEVRDYAWAAQLSRDIARIIEHESGDAFARVVRSKVHNLKENRQLARDLYGRATSAQYFVNMSSVDMKSEAVRSLDEEAAKEGLLSAQMAKATAVSGIFQCAKCKEKKCTYYQLQTRSCDEPMTTFVTCTVCGNRWRF